MEKQYWVKHVASLELEGGSVLAYARAHGISADCLYYWRRKLSTKGPQPPVKVADHVNANKFVALRVGDTTNVAQRIARKPSINPRLLNQTQILHAHDFNNEMEWQWKNNTG